MRILWKIKGNLLMVTGAEKPEALSHFHSKKGVIDGKWHQMAVATRTKSTSIYIDAVLDVEGPVAEGCNLTSESSVFIGASVRVGKKTARHFLGLIDEVSIYNRALA